MVREVNRQKLKRLHIRKSCNQPGLQARHLCIRPAPSERGRLCFEATKLHPVHTKRYVVSNRILQLMLLVSTNIVLPNIANVNCTATYAPLRCESANPLVQIGAVVFRCPQPIPLMILAHEIHAKFCAEQSRAAPKIAQRQPRGMVLRRPPRSA